MISFGATVTEPVSLPTRELFSRAPGAQLHGLYIFDELEHTRSAAATCGAWPTWWPTAGSTRRSTSRCRGPTRRGAIQALLDRRVAGKAVLTID